MRSNFSGRKTKTADSEVTKGADSGVTKAPPPDLVNGMSGEVKWLYPGADKENTGSVSDLEMESELQTDQSVHGSSHNMSTADLDKSSPTASGAETGPTSPLEELPLDQLTTKVAAASSYVGSFFSASAWTQEKKEEPEKVEEEKKLNTVGGAGGGMMAGGLGMMSSAFGKMPGFSKTSPTSDEERKVTEDEEKKGSYFSTSALSLGLSSITSSLTMDNLYSAAGATTAKEQDEKEAEKVEKEDEKEKENWGTSFTDAFTKVGKITSDYSKVLQETVYKAPLISDFNQEQEEFIKNKGGKEQESAPWSGYQNEEELREKILALSEDRRNFLRAPPQGVDFDFEYSAVAAHAVVLLEEDARLQKMRYELVPKKVKEDDFWRNYFYRVGLAKQSFELADSLSTTTTTTTSLPRRPLDFDSDSHLPTIADQDDEFVSELHQASSKDLAEADEAMKKLGLAKNDAEWEAELEGELNEYEMVGGEEGEELSEAQIQAMLDTEK